MRDKLKNLTTDYTDFTDQERRVMDASGANFVFTYFRRAAASGTTQAFEYGNTLSGWTPVAIPGGSGVAVTPDTPVAGIDKVEITVAKGANTQLFGRLQVVK